MSKFYCPACNQPIDCSASSAADGLVCPRCSTEFVPDLVGSTQPARIGSAGLMPRRSRSVLGDVCMAISLLFCLGALVSVLVLVSVFLEPKISGDFYDWTFAGSSLLLCLLCAGIAAAVGQLAYIRRLLENRQ